eukprot:CAMPEP_0197036406 /NCGR_PEP_ID=MMETSP1384-20130603/13918_1 /TAXON_ID=29189 /ORGANISM="Ammonia sp." /LENGTH=399 /DNA_ID=CAMNT_0042466583 /DNA_START=36 /DNA_END=1235 /DNA_ORIENTATION=+
MKHVNLILRLLLAHCAMLVALCSNDMTILSITNSEDGMVVRIITQIDIESEALSNPQIAATPMVNPNDLYFDIYTENEQESCQPLQECYQTFVIEAWNSMNDYCPLLLHGAFSLLFDVMSNDEEVTTINYSIPIKYENELCDAYESNFDIFEMTPTMMFFKDSSFQTELAEQEMYSLHDVCYVELVVPWSSAQLQNVWICTASPTETVFAFASNGCFENNVDQDGPYWIIRNHGSGPSLFNGSILAEFQNATQSAAQTIIRFSFIVPEMVVRDRLYIDIQLALEQDSEISTLFSVFGYINIELPVALMHYDYRYRGKEHAVNVVRPAWIVVLEIMTAILILVSCILMLSVKIFNHGDQQRVLDEEMRDEEEYDKQLMSDDEDDFEDFDKDEMDPLDESY